MGLKPGSDLRHGRVARLILSESDEVAAAGDLEGPPSAVDGVGDVHGRSLADFLGDHPESGEGLRGGCYRRAMTLPPITTGDPRERRLCPRVLRPYRLEPSGLR
jgi:hypothetical protein